MIEENPLATLRKKLQDLAAFSVLSDYAETCRSFLQYLQQTQPTRIVSPKVPNYIFFQFDAANQHAITRPLNQHLFVESPDEFQAIYDRFLKFLDQLRQQQENVADNPDFQGYVQTGEINKTIYTMQQTLGSIADSLPNANQARKRIGQLFENLVKLIIQSIGVACEPRTIRIPIPNNPGYEMSYQLDLVFHAIKRSSPLRHASSTHLKS
jgi:hypothetical protein